MIYLDTSVLEAMSEQVQKLLNEHTEPALSFLTQVELTSAVAQKGEIRRVEQSGRKSCSGKIYFSCGYRTFSGNIH